MSDVQHNADLGLYCEEGERILISYVFSTTPERSLELQQEISKHLVDCKQVNCMSALESRIEEKTQTRDGQCLITLEQMKQHFQEESKN